MVKNQIIKSSFREISSSFPRFLSLLMMSLLGVFVFVGLKETMPFMIDSLDIYLDSQNIYDIKLTSTIGFDEESIVELENNEKIEAFELSRYQDVTLLGKNEQEYTLRVQSNFNIINDLGLTINENEIYVEQNFLDITEYKIGDVIKLNSSNFTYDEFVIKGVCESALYFNNAKLNNSRGKTNIGSGTLNFYAFTSSDAFSIDYYTNIYITVKDAKKEQTNSKKYNRLVDEALKSIDEEILITNMVRKLNDTKQDLVEMVEQYETNVDKVERFTETKTSVMSTINSLGFTTIEEFITYYNSLTTTNESLDALYATSIFIQNNDEQIELLKDVLENNRTIYLDSQANIEQLSKAINNAQVLKSDRFENTTYKNYIDDVNSVKNLSMLFPIVFYAVAILVSLVSMNRMVEDDRLLIGTFKSLGFNNSHIITKYMIFSLMATIIGGVIGAISGILVIPTMINNIYKILFDVPTFYYHVNFSITLLGIFVSIVCICGVTLLTVFKELKEKPAQLLRPKSPKAGKTIFLEKMKFWNKLKFSKKVTTRNLFRYKKRVIITIFSVAGCSALLLCGFGIRDSITDIPEKQYGEIIKEDAMVIINNLSEEDSMEILNRNEVLDYTLIMNISGSVDDYAVSINVLKDNYQQFFNFIDLQTKEQTLLKDNEVIISDKLAQLLNKKKGDVLTFTDDDMNSYNYTISCVCEFYINHDIFMTEQTYNETNNDYYINLAYLKLKELNDVQKEDLQKTLLETGNVINISYKEDIINEANDMLKTLNKVVVILIVLSMMLSFVVLYNLSNINIQERKREIATLKVLGFYPKEVDRYITSENIILTLLGIIIGMIFGYFFTNIVVATVEIENVRFIHHIKTLSYVYSIVLSFAFTFIVNMITHISLQKIDMIEALKSVE